MYKTITVFGDVVRSLTTYTTLRSYDSKLVNSTIGCRVDLRTLRLVSWATILWREHFLYLLVVRENKKKVYLCIVTKDHDREKTTVFSFGLFIIFKK